jgi:hypothetical protein
MAGWGTIILLLLAVLATWVAWHAFREGQVDPVMLGAAVLLLAFVLWGIFRLVPAWGRARIVLDRAGFVTPFHGRIGWKDVNGVMLKRVEHRGIEYSFLSLRLVAPRFEDFHWTERVLAGFRRGVRRNVIDVPLKYTGASPDEVVAVARFLRKQATGEDHDWDPLLSDAYHDAMRRLSMRSAPDPDSFAKEVRENPEAALHGMEQAAADLETASAEIARLSRRARRSRAWAVLLLCGMLAAGMYKIFSR